MKPGDVVIYPYMQLETVLQEIDFENGYASFDQGDYVTNIPLHLLSLKVKALKGGES